MYRSILSLAAAAVLAGCAGGNAAPGELPKDMTTGIYTMADPHTVAACIGRVLGSPVTPVGDRLVIASRTAPGVSYSVGANRKGDVYPTQVAIAGDDHGSEEAVRVSRCANADAAAAN